jgi:hypothetical protein
LPVDAPDIDAKVEPDEKQQRIKITITTKSPRITAAMIAQTPKELTNVPDPPACPADVTSTAMLVSRRDRTKKPETTIILENEAPMTPNFADPAAPAETASIDQSKTALTAVDKDRKESNWPGDDNRMRGFRRHNSASEVKRNGIPRLNRSPEINRQFEIDCFHQ